MAMRASIPATPSPDVATPVALFAVLLWSATPLMTKVAVQQMDPLAVALLRTELAALVALPAVFLVRPALPRSTPARLELAVSALGAFVLFPVLLALGLARTGAGHAALIIAAAPVATGLIAALLERRRLAMRWWWGCAVALAGTGLLAAERFGFGDGDSVLAGDLLVLAGVLCAATGYVTGARAAREIGTWAATLWGLLLGGLALLSLAPVALAPAGFAGAGPIAWAAVGYLALGSSIAAYAAWYWALGRGGIARTGLIQFLQPLVGLGLAVAVLDEAVSVPMVLAGLLILGGVALARGRA